MRSHWTRAAVVVAGGVLVVSLAGCGQGSSQAQEDAPIRVEVSQMFITVENRAGLALRNVKVQIIPYGGATDFSVMVYRLENAMKRDIPLADFRGLDGTPFKIRVVRSKSVKVSGTDIDGKTIEVEVPWKVTR